MDSIAEFAPSPRPVRLNEHRHSNRCGDPGGGPVFRIFNRNCLYLAVLLLRYRSQPTPVTPVIASCVPVERLKSDEIRQA